jgi:hypothetical protein
MTLINTTAFATPPHNKYTHLNPIFERKENEDMEYILQFFAKPTNSLLTHFSVALYDEPGLVLGIDSTHSKTILLHNIEVSPATRQNPDPVIRALYSVGRKVTPILLDKHVFEIP